MNIETLTTLFLKASQHGLDFYDGNTVPEEGGAMAKAFRTPFYRSQRHDHMEIICRLEGEPMISINGGWAHYADDRVKVFIPGAWHTEHFSKGRQAYRILWCKIMSQAVMFHLTAYTAAKGYSASSKRLALSPPMCSKLWECSIDPALAISAVRQAEFHYLFMETLCFCIKNETLFPFSSKDFHHHVVGLLKTYIEDHYWESITLEGLADVFHYSPKHLNALFKKATGTPLLHHVNTLRMRKAREILRSGTMLVKQAAESVGIHDPLYFSKKFRQHFGRSPRDYVVRQKA